MDRKTFLQKTLQMGLTGWILFSGKLKATSPENKTDNSARNGDKMDSTFKEKWLKSLLKNMDEQLDETERMKLMESCGRDCARRQAIKIAKSCKGDLDQFLKKLTSILGSGNVQKQKEIIHLKYSKCYCHLVNKNIDRLSRTYCFCSRGWVMEMFETCTGKPVRVELLKSIKQGHSHCHFTIRF